MSAHENLLEAIKESAKDGLLKTVNISEASSLTGSGDGKGGRTYFDDAFAQARYINPLRQVARQINAPNSSAVSFPARKGNATKFDGTANNNNPWNYAFPVDNGNPNATMGYWQLPTRAVTAQFPIRSAVLADINGLDSLIISDLLAELSQQEAYSMCRNNDQTGTTTLATGGTNGLRGLDMYTDSTTAVAWGTNGNGSSDGIHTILKLALSASAFDYDHARQLKLLLPPVYWNDPSCAFMITPAKWAELTNDTNHETEVGSRDGSLGVGLSVMGTRVIVNPYLSDAFPVYLAAWDKFLTIADVQEVSVQVMESTTPGFMTIYAMKRLVSSIRDPYAGVRCST